MTYFEPRSVGNALAELMDSDSTDCVLYFTAPWCAPCVAMAPTIADLVVAGVNVIKVDIDAVAGAIEYWGVTSVPTFVRFKDGVEVARKIGAMGKVELFQFSGVLQEPLFT